MNRKPWYEIKAKDTKKDSTEILIYDEIGESWFGEGVTAKNFVKDLQGIKTSTINVRINSPGGNVFGAFAIFNALQRHAARVETDIDGMALSAASYIALAGAEVRMARNAHFMIHNPHAVAIGEAGDMRKMAETLDKIRDSIAGIYQDRTGAKLATIHDWMDDETWFLAEEALDAKFIDAITTEQAVTNCFNLSKFHRVPGTLVAAIQARNPYRHHLLRMQRASAPYQRKGVTR